MIRDLFKWQPGRQGGKYKKLKVFKFLFFDCWVIKYEPNYYMPSHTDPVKDRKHFRLNVVIKGHARFNCVRTIFKLGNRVIFFRPDLYKHSIINGPSERTVLSIGAAF